MEATVSSPSRRKSNRERYHNPVPSRTEEEATGMRYLKRNQHFVVMATHPDKPNFGGQARGRKLHLAITRRKKFKTLCNMLVVEGVEQNSFQADRAMCQTCQAKATEIIQDRFDKSTYSFTINTDASHYAAHTGVSSWACWIKSSHYLVKDAGVFPEGIPNSSVAELLAVEQALLLLDKLIDTEPFLQHHLDNGRILIFFNTDSLFTVQALNGTIKKTKYADIITRVRSLAARYEINPRHVKGHTRGEVPREWVNNWCDQQARRLASARLKELNNANKAS